jgi:hypothetical protein
VGASCKSPAKRERIESDGCLEYAPDLTELVERDQTICGLTRMIDETPHGIARVVRCAYSCDSATPVVWEQLRKSVLPPSPYTYCLDRELHRRLKTNMRSRWLLDRSPNEHPCVPTALTRNRERLTEHRLTHHCLRYVSGETIDTGLASDVRSALKDHLMQSQTSPKNLGCV